MNKIIDTATRVHSVCEKVLVHLQSPLLLAIRLYWGWQFFQTGYGKLMHISKVVGFFTSLGIPFPAFNAYFVSSLECVGGVLLFLGLGSRVIALPLTIDMLVLVQVNGRGWSFQLSVKVPMAAVSSVTEVKVPRRMAWRVMEEAQELAVAVAGQQAPVTVAVAACRAADKAVVLWRMSSCLCRSGMPGRTGRTGRVQISPDLGFLIHADHHRVLRRRQVEPHDVADLRFQRRVGGEREPLGPVRLQAELAPQHRDRVMADADAAGPAAASAPATGSTSASPPGPAASPAAGSPSRPGSRTPPGRSAPSSARPDAARPPARPAPLRRAGAAA